MSKKVEQLEFWQISQREKEFQTGRCVEANTFDIWHYEQRRANDFDVSDLEERFIEIIGGNPMPDGAQMLYRVEPKFKEPVARKLQSIKRILDIGLNLPDYAKLHKRCKGDMWLSVAGAMIWLKKVLENLPAEMPEQMRGLSELHQILSGLQDEIDQLAGQQEILQQMLEQDSGNEQAQDKLDETEQELEDKQSERQELEIEIIEAEKELGQAFDENQSRLENAVSRALDEALGEIDAQASFIKHFSLAAGISGHQIDPDIAKAAMELIKGNRNLLEFANHLGRIMRLAQGAYDEVEGGNLALVRISPAPINLPTMTPMERMAMVSGSPVLYTGWLTRAANDEVMHEVHLGEHPLSFGDMVLVWDSSGSIDSQQFQTEVSIVWALQYIARQQDRRFISIKFSGTGQFDVWIAPEAGQGDVNTAQEMVKHLTYHFRGGTEPYNPMLQAFRVIEEKDLSADIGLISDGYFAAPSPEFLQSAGEADCHIYAVSIDGNNPQMEKFAQLVIRIDDLLDVENESKIRRLFENMATAKKREK